MKRKINVADVPSDTESVDGLCDSDNDGEASTSSHQKNQIEIPILSDVILNDEDVEEEEDEEVLENVIWGGNGLPKRDLPFTKDFGPNIPTNVKTPLEIFFCLFPDTLINIIVEQTNLYARQKKSKQKEVTRDEIIVFLGINILMGVKKLPSYRDYWSTNPQLHDAYISSLMTVNRFGFLLSHLHINDNAKEPKKGDQSYDKLYKLRPVLDELGQTFKQCWKPGKYQSIDETMIKFKGRNSMKQYAPAKPTKRGYKSWTRADESGFVCEFQVYTGKAETAEKQLGSRVVKDLTRELVGGNHHVYFDNFFTGVDLLLSLRDDQIFACGTVRSNRSKLPKSKRKDNTMEKGEYESQSTSTGLQWFKWMDKKAVYFLSNYHDPSEATVVNRRQKDGSLQPVNCPVAAADYNKHMGYVDYADRLLAIYKIDRKSKRWWLRLFWHFLDLAVVNSFIIYTAKETQPSMTLKNFRLKIVEGLVDHKEPLSKGRKRKSADTNFHKPQVSDTKRKSGASHMPVHKGNFRRCAHCSTKTSVKRTAWICTMCDVPLCLSAEKNCFLEFHK